MAKYEINHACGHSRTVQLYGPHVERDRKIEWMSGQDCPQCWAAKKRAEDAAKPITMTIQANGLDTDNDGNLLAEIVLTGGTMPRKKKIGDLGYYWTEVRGGVMDMFSMSRAPMAWVKRVPIIELEISHPTAKQIKVDAEQLGATIVNGIGPIDMAMLQQHVENKRKADEDKIKRDAAIATIPKPEYPACHPFAQHKGKAMWNKKYYGSERSGYSYYIDNVMYKLTIDEYKQCMIYREAINNYKTQIDAIK